MSEYIQKGYIRIADIMPILDDMRITDIPKLYAMLTINSNILQEV
jgi:hypothetical protein